MVQKYFDLIQKNVRNILESTPEATLVLVDTVGGWMIEDLQVIFANKASEKLFGEKFYGPFIFQTPATRNSLQAQLSHVKSEINLGNQGFSGPFSHTYSRHDQTIIHIENYIMYLGKVDGSLVFLTVVRDRTAEEFMRQMNTCENTPRTESLDILSDREKSVVVLILKKLKTEQIAQNLGVSRRTIDNHRANIRRKLHLTNTAVSLQKYLSNA